MIKKHPVAFPDFNTFNSRLQQLLEDHAAACRAVVVAAAELAFPANVISAPIAGRARQPRKQTDRRPRLVKLPARRAPAEIAAVCERLYQAVCVKPGESKAVLAAAVGLSAQELDRPMNHLKKSARVRTVGLRHFTRYFPLVGEVAQTR
jgi:hypothetical protein